MAGRLCAHPAIEVQIVPATQRLRVLFGLRSSSTGYDTLPEPRRFDFVPLWGIAVVLRLPDASRECPDCGVKVERVPWAEGKSPLTTEYKWFLAGWARRMTWKEVADCLLVSWDHVYNAVKHAVSWGLCIADLDGIESIGVDEVQWKRGPQVPDGGLSDRRRHRNVAVDRSRSHGQDVAALLSFLGKERSARLQFMCSDMWQGYLKVIAKKARKQSMYWIDFTSCRR